MGGNVTRSAGVDRIKDSGEKTLTAARARGGEVASLAEARIAPAMSALEDNEKQLDQARADDDKKHAELIARDNESDLEVGAVCNEIWNALGRPGQSLDYNLIVNGGKKVWTDGDPVKQPALMGVLAQNIRATDHPKLAAKKEEWAKRIETKAAAQAEAAKPTEGSYAVVMSLRMQRRTLADTLQMALVRFKRDLKNLGMTEAQAHEIIPDVSPSRGKVPEPAAKPAT